MQRYIAFLDILGFGDLVETLPLSEITRRLGMATEYGRYSECLGKIIDVDGVAHPDEAFRAVYRFSFSDSFALVTKELSKDSLNSIIVTTCLFAQGLFAFQLPVRGAIVSGEADFIPGSDHLVGRGIIEAIRMEKKQDWFGIALAPEIGIYKDVVSQLDPRVAPMIVSYPIPLKEGICSDGVALNWRLNITSELGTRSFFPTPKTEEERRKHNNTIAFAKHVRDSNQAYTDHDRFWLRPIYLPMKSLPDLPFTIDQLKHGDEF